MGNRSTSKHRKHIEQPSRKYTVGELHTMPLLYPDLAGIDIGSRVHYVSVPGDRSERSVRTFGCMTPDLIEMVNWLKGCGITHVVMESTGVYWVPVAMVLEEAGFKVSLVDARESHRLMARKTDVQDCQWIRQLYACGLLRNAFRPAQEMLQVRSYWRQRKELVHLCATALHHMQKALELMNVQVHKVVSDIAGVTGMRIIRAMVKGQRDPESFLEMVHANCKSSRKEFRKALTGHYAPEQVFALSQALRRHDMYQEQMAELDQELKRSLREFPDAENPNPDAPPAESKSRDGKRRKNQSHFNLAAELQRITGVDLTRIEGIDALTAFTVISEQGIDMSAFPSEKHFASHLGLCPNNQITGGRVRNRRTRRVHSRAADALRVAAQSLARSKTALGAFFRRMRARQGAAKAIVATAHKLAKIIYRMLKHGEEYVAHGQEQYEKDYRERLLKNLKRQAKLLGCQVLVPETGELLS
jgi:transposase